MSFAFLEKFSLDLCYWDPNNSEKGNFCTGPVFQCDSRFVATLKATW